MIGWIRHASKRSELAQPDDLPRDYRSPRKSRRPLAENSAAHSWHECEQCGDRASLVAAGPRFLMAEACARLTALGLKYYRPTPAPAQNGPYLLLAKHGCEPQSNCNSAAEKANKLGLHRVQPRVPSALVVVFVMARSPFQRSNAGIIWVEHPGDYANPIPTTPATAPEDSSCLPQHL